MKTTCYKKMVILAVFFLIPISFSVSAETSGIFVKAKGSKANGVYSQFKVIVNDVDCGYQNTSSLFEDYHFHTPFTIDEIEIIKIEFINDLYSIGEDRNLCIYSVFIEDDVPILASPDNVKYFCMNGDEYPYCGMMQWNGTLVFDVSKLRFHPGNVTLSSQSEVDAFNSQYLNGNLTVSGNDITDLSPLADLTRINGALIIKNNPNLQNIYGFNSLSKLDFIHIENNAKLEQIDGFSALMRCGGVYIQNNNKLKTIKCFLNPQLMM